MKTASTFTNSRQQKLAAVQVLPKPPAKAVARLFFQHGVGEHVGRYTRVFDALAERGVAVFAFDAHGHGLSEPKADADRCLIWSFSHLVNQP